MPRRYEIEDEQWKRIKHLFPIAKTGRPAKCDNKIMFNAILWFARSGSAWKDLPSRYLPHQTVYSRFCKWREDGTFKKIFKELGKDADMENLYIYSTSIKAHPQSAGAKKGL
ncbi:hypothetical protein HMPREF1142_0601 [Peptostreptococcaceae bacterium AS15]|nr:hypothetical protein HMPREF1142_0601 [Peptostreptococcaceae bacterium AS15]